MVQVDAVATLWRFESSSGHQIRNASNTKGQRQLPFLFFRFASPNSVIRIALNGRIHIRMDTALLLS
jgi:hypothetical protein